MPVDTELHHEIGRQTRAAFRVGSGDADIIIAARHAFIALPKPDEVRIAIAKARFEILRCRKARVELRPGVTRADRGRRYRLVAALLIDHAAEKPASLGRCFLP